MSLRILTYVREEHPLLQRVAFRLIESVGECARFLRDYRYEFTPWLVAFERDTPLIWNDGLGRLGIQRRLHGESWPPTIPKDDAVLMVANHPLGVFDGLTMLAFAEQMGRRFRILIDQALLRFEPLRKFALSVDFSDAPAAKTTNIESRREARACLLRGEIVIVFPTAGVAIARNPFGPAVDQPWGRLNASLILETRATTVPIFLPGRASRLAHALGKIKIDLRRTLMASEFCRRCGSPIDVHIGAPIDFEQLRAIGPRSKIMSHLRCVVLSLESRAA